MRCEKRYQMSRKYPSAKALLESEENENVATINENILSFAGQVLSHSS